MNKSCARRLWFGCTNIYEVCKLNGASCICAVSGKPWKCYTIYYCFVNVNRRCRCLFLFLEVFWHWFCWSIVNFWMNMANLTIKYGRKFTFINWFPKKEEILILFFYCDILRFQNGWTNLLVINTFLSVNCNVLFVSILLLLSFLDLLALCTYHWFVSASSKGLPTTKGLRY